MKSARALLFALTAVACIAALFSIVRTYNRASAADTFAVRAVAHEWWWEFDYPSLGVRSSNVLYLPSGVEVKLELTSADTIHSFWIAGMKRSMKIVPGKARLLELLVKSPGELYGNCDSECGCGKVCMRFRVLASPRPDFQRWAASARLRGSGFKPPRTNGTPSCALNSAYPGHAKSNVSHSRLQQLLDKDSAAESD